jgi:hypothetical protein
MLPFDSRTFPLHARQFLAFISHFEPFHNLIPKKTCDFLNCRKDNLFFILRVSSTFNLRFKHSPPFKRKANALFDNMEL